MAVSRDRDTRVGAGAGAGAGDALDAAVGRIGFVVHRRRAAGWSIHEHANAELDILAFAEAGRAFYRCRGEHFGVKRGTMLFFPRGTAHSGWADRRDPWSFHSIGFELESTADTRPGAFEALPMRVALANAPQIVDLLNQLERHWHGREPGFMLGCRGTILVLLQQFVAAAERQARAIPHAQSLERIVDMLHANVGHMYSVGHLAAKAGLSESRFRLLFRQLTGYSATRYQNRLRIHAARDLLLSGQYTVTAVAEELGFRDVYYFSRLFKTITGTSPSTYQNR